MWSRGIVVHTQSFNIKIGGRGDTMQRIATLILHRYRWCIHFSIARTSAAAGCVRSSPQPRTTPRTGSSLLVSKYGALHLHANMWC